MNIQSVLLLCARDFMQAFFKEVLAPEGVTLYSYKSGQELSVEMVEDLAADLIVIDLELFDSHCEKLFFMYRDSVFFLHRDGDNLDNVRKVYGNSFNQFIEKPLELNQLKKFFKNYR
ncbi:MAG: hypothetical protein H6621_11355 [Halobacteriovoraceae bacterium]|nr:hypothetical protein [Halobacteriovoraceae bacterium]MCB9095656.1 hypothetical protein [Halobacteriovoraceae bacterium]